MRDNPLVSVVLTTYNDDKYIRETIESVLNQTYREYEFIIWNDGSTDNTERFIKSFNDSRIRYFCHENTGVGKAADMACAEARGKYIARIDGDDLCLPERLEKEVDFLENNPDYVVVSSSVIYIDENGNEIGRSFSATSDNALRKQLRYVDPIVHPACMYTRDAYLKSGGYVGIRQSLDHVFFGRISKYGKIKNLSEPQIKYRLRSNSLSHLLGGNHYDKILMAYRHKLISDENVLPADVDIYNQIFFQSRQLKIEGNQSNTKRKKTVEEKVFSFLKPLFGTERSEVFICGLKNLYVMMFVK